MPNLTEIQARQSRYMDSLIASFENHLAAIVNRAQAKTLNALLGKLVITDGVIQQTPGNLRAVRHLNDLFMKFMNREGYQHLLDTFVNQFPNQLPFLQQTISFLSQQMKEPLPRATFTASDLQVFAGVRTSTVAALQATIEAGAGVAMTQSMFSVGGLKFADLTQSFIEKTGATVARAKTLADTSMSTFYRTMTDRAFQYIEADLPQQQVKYRFWGPLDLRTRPFCRHLLEVDKGYTREQINQMHNGQMPNVFLTGGGWNCRDVWILDTRDLKQRLQQKAAA